MTMSWIELIFNLEDCAEILLQVLDNLSVLEASNFAQVCVRFRKAHKTWFPFRACNTRQWENIDSDLMSEKITKAVEMLMGTWKSEHLALTEGNVDLDACWAVQVAPKAMSVGRMLRQRGLYEVAEHILLAALGGDRTCLPSDDVTDDDDVQDLEQSLLCQLKTVDEALAAGQENVIAAAGGILGELCRVSEDKRLSFHYFNMMLPWAARACCYAQHAILCDKNGISIAEMRLLLNINLCWSLIGAIRSDPGPAAASSLRVAMDAARLQLAIIRTLYAADTEGLARVQQAVGTSHYVEAVVMTYSDEARASYDRAQACFLEALNMFAQCVGKSHLSYANCAVELGICYGNRRRTVDPDDNTKRLAAMWYNIGYQGRKDVLGDNHPLTIRAWRGFESHSNLE